MKFLCLLWTVKKKRLQVSGKPGFFFVISLFLFTYNYLGVI